MSVPSIRCRELNNKPLEPNRRYVLYWMTAFRRPKFNFALERAVEYASELQKPLVIFEALRAGYLYASTRIHQFILQGMQANQRAFGQTRAQYIPYVERRAGDGKGLLEMLAKQACVVVSDDWPGFFVPRMQEALASRLDVKCDVVDSNGLFPMRATTRIFTTAHSFRAYLHKHLKPHLLELPAENPAAAQRFPKGERVSLGRYEAADLSSIEALLAQIQIDDSVKPVSRVGGHEAALERMQLFVAKKMADYGEARNEPEVDGTSALSPYLHFGHISAHEIFVKIVQEANWTTEKTLKPRGGSRAGWWNLHPSTEAFLDELVTWRELAFNMASHRPVDGHTYESLPAWALASHQKHATDERPHLYSLEQMERGQTHDALWNATQMQLVREGWFHNYLRMLWGKKILEWCPSAKEALRRMEFLMSKYSLDGRDPVSTSGYLWVLGRYDRAWGPERKIFGKIRYMSSDNTAKKIDVKQFIKKYAP
jgi:deoxyribodipyrimidine photo-lyase